MEPVCVCPPARSINRSRRLKIFGWQGSARILGQLFTVADATVSLDRASRAVFKLFPVIAFLLAHDPSRLRIRRKSLRKAAAANILAESILRKKVPGKWRCLGCILQFSFLFAAWLKLLSSCLPPRQNFPAVNVEEESLRKLFSHFDFLIGDDAIQEVIKARLRNTSRVGF